MTVKEALKINERMLEAFVWLAPEFERLRNPALRKLMAGRVSVEQAARIGGIPLTEALYVLNLAAGEDETVLTRELTNLKPDCFKSREENPTRKPRELAGIREALPHDTLLPHDYLSCLTNRCRIRGTSSGLTKEG
jgi:hypothetical protein